MALSELAILVAVTLGFGGPLYRYYVVTRDDRRRKPAERFEHACREAGFVPVPEDGEAREGESTWRGQSLGADLVARRTDVGGASEVEVSLRLTAPLNLGLELTTAGPLPGQRGERSRNRR